MCTYLTGMQKVRIQYYGVHCSIEWTFTTRLAHSRSPIGLHLNRFVKQCVDMIPVYTDFHRHCWILCAHYIEYFDSLMKFCSFLHHLHFMYHCRFGSPTESPFCGEITRAGRSPRFMGSMMSVCASMATLMCGNISLISSTIYPSLRWLMDRYIPIYVYKPTLRICSCLCILL